MKRPNAKIQYYQLTIVALIHFVADMFVGMIVPLMPHIRNHFKLENVGDGVLLIGVSHLVMNLSQMCVGHMRPARKKPLLIFIGLLLVSAMAFIGFLPSAGPGMAWLLIILIASMIGAGITHPESMRSLHLLKRTNASLGSALFMTGGYLGYGFGGWMAAIVVMNMGLKGLVWFLPAVALIIIAVLRYRIRLATDNTRHIQATNEQMRNNSMPFWPMWLMLLPFCIGHAILMNLAPEYYKLQFGVENYLPIVANLAIAATIGGLIGGMWWSHWAQNRNIIKVCVALMIAGMPFMLYFVFNMEKAWTVWLLMPAYFFMNAAFPLLTTAARFAKGLNLGQRMAIVSGGSWTIALSCYMALYPIINDDNLYLICKLALSGYFISIIIGFYCIYRQRQNKLKEIK